MPISSQNEFLLSFLHLLGNEQTMPRTRMMFQLAKRFEISQDEAQPMSGSLANDSSPV